MADVTEDQAPGIAETVRPLSADDATFCDPPPYEFDSVRHTRVRRRASDPIWAVLSDSAKWPLLFEDSLFVARSAIENLYAAGFVVARRQPDSDGGPDA